jgi:phosphoglycolate phosphatase
MLKAVLFDLDGVLVQSYDSWFRLVSAAAQDLGYPVVTIESFAATWGQGVDEDVRHFFPRHSRTEVERYYAEHFGAHADSLQVQAGAKMVLDDLVRTHIGTAVVTNTPTDIARTVIRAANLQPQFIVGSTDVEHDKPAPDMLLLACRKLAVTPIEALMVGDSHYDERAARAAGIRFAGFGGIIGVVTWGRLADVMGLVAG